MPVQAFYSPKQASKASQYSGISMNKVHRNLIAFLMVMAITVSIAGIVAAIKFKQFNTPAPAGFPPIPVTSYTAVPQEWEQSVNAVGSLQPYQGVTVTCESAGTVSAIHFESGQKVAEGDLLIELDTSIEQAQLQAAKAAAELAMISLQRSRELRQSNTIPQSDLDAAESSALQARAQLAQVEAVIAKKRIRAPFSGILGIRQVNLGEYIGPGSPIVPLQDLDPIYVDFSLPQSMFDAVHTGYQIRAEVDTFPNTPFEGFVQAIDPELDPVNRTFRVRGELDNSELKLRPGMFVSVEVIQPATLDVVPVPITAVYYQSFGNSIFVIQPGNPATVEQRNVTLGKTKGDFIAILEGLEADEEVVSTGVFKLRNGGSVAVNNEEALELSTTPDPEDS